MLSECVLHNLHLQIKYIFLIYAYFLNFING